MNHILDTATTSTDKRWEIILKRETLFNNVSLRTNYINDKLPIEHRDDNKILSEDDMAIFNKYLRAGIAEINTILARYYKREFDDYEIDDESIYFNLSFVLNAKNSIAFTIKEYLAEFLELYILKRWYGQESKVHGIDYDIAETELKLRAAINYRSTPVRRKAHPIF